MSAPFKEVGPKGKMKKFKDSSQTKWIWCNQNFYWKITIRGHPRFKTGLLTGHCVHRVQAFKMGVVSSQTCGFYDDENNSSDWHC